MPTRPPALPRRRVLRGTAAAAGLLVLPGRAPAQGGKKKLDGVTLHVACYSHTYSEFLRSYLPEFEQMTGAKVVYETPAFPIYNQRMDIELSTRSPAHDVINVTFIYSGRWVGAGWTTPLDDYFNDPAKTPADFDIADFLPGSTAAFKDRQGRLHAIPWIADAQMAGASRYDLIEQAGFKQPDTFDQMPALLKALKAKGGPSPFGTENHYGWQFPPYLLAFGGQVFRKPPDDLHPMLDTPEAIHAADFFSAMLREYGPDGVLTYTSDQFDSGVAGRPHQLFDLQPDLPGRNGAAGQQGRQDLRSVDGAGRTGRPFPECRLAWLGHSGRGEAEGRIVGVYHLGNVQILAAAHVQGEGLQFDHPRIDHQTAGVP